MIRFAQEIGVGFRGGQPIQALEVTPSLQLSARQLRLKRVVDFTLALILLVICVPVFVVIAILIKATSRGPVLFRQVRLMQHGQPFTMLKFRTMRVDADTMLDLVFHLNEANGPLFKVKNDPRMTPVGKALRRAYLDELPQLLNVLHGELSLVGPRPCLPMEFDRMDGQIAFRFTVPQGLTGPWQASGCHRLTFEEQIAIERDYVQNWSIRKDFAIMLRTVPLMLSFSGM